MSHEYYCTSCAKKLDQKKVLYDMQELLTGSGGKGFQILKFRLTEAEVLAIYQNGKKQEDGTVLCSLPFSNLMSYICNQNNLNLSISNDLTLDAIKQFTEKYRVPDVHSHEESTEHNVLDALRANIVDDLEGESAESEEPEEKEEEEKKEEYVMPSCLIQLRSKDAKTDSPENSNLRLRDDLLMVLGKYLGGETFDFRISLRWYDADDGSQVLYGMTIRVENDAASTIENRVCPSCGRRIFSYAGTAEHKIAVFIGDQSSGKTSTILALAHYAENHLMCNIGNKIWENSRSITNVEDVVRLNAVSRHVDESAAESNVQKIDKELDYYNRGIAPAKTHASERDDAYSVTLRIRSKAVESEKDIVKILTLIDLPGELCLRNGTLDRDKILNQFQSALYCDVFVTCFDTSVVRRAAQGAAADDNQMRADTETVVHRTPAEIVSSTCRWADEFQKLMVEEHRRESYVPTILLYTKCEELENGTEETKNIGKAKNLVEEAHMFYDELQEINKNPIYAYARKRFCETGNLTKAFHAELRCSPYGYPAPAANEADIVEAHSPTPKHIDDLMRWLLMVIGSVEVEGKYRTAFNTNNFYSLNHYRINRIQYRYQNPNFNGNNPDESLARCVLFANPGQHDKNYLAKYGNRTGMFFAKMRAKQDSNDM